ncbi:MAG: SMC-Scp complex subunit ScpB [Myxococcales bacterium]|nr:SMC-Scp complex subunit ScpB [Myxococcales bacterium]
MPPGPGPAPAVEPTAPGTGPGQFSEEEIASATAPAADPELDEVEPAEIESPEPELETPLEKLQQKARRMSPERVRTVIESLLFVTDRPFNVDQLFETTGIDRPRIHAALEKIAGQLRDGISGIVLHEVAGGWQLRTDPGSSEYVRRFLQVKPQRLTRAAVETLAIIAYRQPVTRPEVEDIRGVDSGAVIKALLERRLIKILGRKEEVGRPILYGTTREFLEFFALKDLASLPTLREFQELTEEHREIVEKEAPPKVEGVFSELADPTFRRKLEAESGASEAALAELEDAIFGADRTAKIAATALGTPKDEQAAAEPSAPNPQAPTEG